jgi:hypothetical protein
MVAARLARTISCIKSKEAKGRIQLLVQLEPFKPREQAGPVTDKSTL